MTDFTPKMKRQNDTQYGPFSTSHLVLARNHLLLLTGNLLARCGVTGFLGVSKLLF